jgi:hypothetical protein
MEQLSDFVLFKECLQNSLIPFSIIELNSDYNNNIINKNNKNIKLDNFINRNGEILISKQNRVLSIDFCDRGLGDEQIFGLAESLKYCNCLQKINISNNNLSNDSLLVFLDNLFSFTSCVEVDVSKNVLNEKTKQFLIAKLKRVFIYFFMLLLF